MGSWTAREKRQGGEMQECEAGESLGNAAHGGNGQAVSEVRRVRKTGEDQDGSSWQRLCEMNWTSGKAAGLLDTR